MLSCGDGGMGEGAEEGGGGISDFQISGQSLIKEIVITPEPVMIST